jgi:hypothetical protein
MQPARRGVPTRAIVAVVALLLGLALVGAWRVISGSQDLPFDNGATPPSSVHVTADKTYSLAVPGGVAAMLARGVPTRVLNSQTVINLQCAWSTAGAAQVGNDQPLPVSPEAVGTKAETTVAHFVAPRTGQVRVFCSGWGAMFVPDSDDRAHDWAGLALLLATILLTVGAAFALVELRAVFSRPRELSDEPMREDEQVE